jgi:hypothetical protein
MGEGSPSTPAPYRANPVGRQLLVGREAAWEQTESTAIPIWGEGRWEAHQSSGVPVMGQPAVVGSVGEVGEHLRGRAMLLVGSTGLVEHQRRWSTVAIQSEEAMAGDELAPGPDVLGASSSGILRGEGKVGVWFPGSDDDRVVGKGGDGKSREEWHCS